MKIKPPSDFIMPGIDVKDGDILTILDEGEYRTLPQNPDRKLLVFKVKLPSGEEKLLTMNATSQRELIRAWGNESREWIKKKVRVELVKQKVFDRTREVIYLKPVESKKGKVKVQEVPPLNED